MIGRNAPIVVADERDLRLWVRRSAPAAWWVEPGRGGTVGLPDCYVAVGGRQAWLELKLAEVNRVGWRFALRPPQKRAFRELRAAGVPCGVLAAKGGRGIVVTDLGSILAGRVDHPAGDFSLAGGAEVFRGVFEAVFSTAGKGCENDPKS